MSARANLGGIPLVALGTVGWTFEPGVRAHYRTFEAAAEDARKIHAQGGPLTLSIEIPGYPPLRVEQLHVISLLPGRMPHTLGVKVGDRRHLWSLRFIARDYNMRRRTGDTRMISEGNPANVVPAHDIAYWTYSLDNGTPWTAESMLRDVLGHLGLPYDFQSEIKRKIEVEDLELRGRLDRMLGHALAYLAGYEVWLDGTGTLHVYDTYEGLGAESEGDYSGTPREVRNPGTGADVGAGSESFSPWGPVVVGTGYIARADRRYVRPVKARIGFEEECELRFNYHEGDEDGDSTRNAEKRPALLLENVMASPDVQLEVTSAAGKVRTVGQGSWITVDEAFRAWPTSSYPTSGRAPGALSHDAIRRHWLRDFTDLMSLYAVGNGGQVEPVWVQRINAIRQHWRQTFRIVRPWRDRIRSIRPYRAALLDHENGLRATAPVYCDWLAKADLHVYARKEAEYHRLGWQVEGYHALLASAKVAPVAVSVLDEDQGILHFGFHRDPAGQAHEVAPGRLPPGDKLPSNDAAASEVAWARNRLHSVWNAAVVVSCVRSAPNTAARFHWIEVTPADVEEVLGRAVGPCEGPEVEIHVTGGRLTARFAWDDDAQEQIETAFEVGTPMPGYLLSNRAEVQAVAEAEAARYYARYMDRLEGQCAVPWNPTIKIEGSMSSVTHSLNTRGIPLTWIALTPQLEPLDTMAFVPKSVQRIIRRMVQP